MLNALAPSGRPRIAPLDFQLSGHPPPRQFPRQERSSGILRCHQPFRGGCWSVSEAIRAKEARSTFATIGGRAPRYLFGSSEGWWPKQGEGELGTTRTASGIRFRDDSSWTGWILGPITLLLDQFWGISAAVYARDGEDDPAANRGPFLAGEIRRRKLNVSNHAGRGALDGLRLKTKGT